MATERKAAIVTGAASGLGRAMALGLAGSGMDVVAVDRNTAMLATLASGRVGQRGLRADRGRRPRPARRRSTGS
jgi:NAD(P)-dependent dehydrogenase (short-subunit alcohol dehydrogenase family)